MRKTQRGRSHLVPRLDGQNMFLDPRRQIPCSPKERDSQRFGGKRIEDWQAEAAVLNDFQVKRKETKVSLFLVLPLTAKYIWIGRPVEPCWLERRRAGRWGEDREGLEGHLAPSSCSAQWRQVVRPLIYKASYNKGWSKCYWNQNGFLKRIEQLTYWKNGSTNFSYSPWIH